MTLAQKDFYEQVDMSPEEKAKSKHYYCKFQVGPLFWICSDSPLVALREIAFISLTGGNIFLQGLDNHTYIWTYFLGINLKNIFSAMDSFSSNKLRCSVSSVCWLILIF